MPGKCHRALPSSEDSRDPPPLRGIGLLIDEWPLAGYEEVLTLGAGRTAQLRVRRTPTAWKHGDMSTLLLLT
ncbi:unannotated protein [freshwater metagenome]|uniref:Unannotated protein n=1 Tax=freshwater metagenome TaxID=449393 RepID=A0A6J7R8Z7_9ZZZZ